MKSCRTSLERVAPLVLGGAALIALAAACTTTVDSSPPGTGDAVILQAPATHAWRVVSAAGEVGLVVRFEEAATGRFLYSVRNEHNQDLGIVDAEGRAYRFRPHAEPEWLSTGTVRDGVCSILGTPDGQMQELTLDELRED